MEAASRASVQRESLLCPLSQLWREAEKWDSSWSREGAIGMGVMDMGEPGTRIVQANENDPEENKRLMIQGQEGHLISGTGGGEVGVIREVGGFDGAEKRNVALKKACFLSEMGHEVFS